MTDPVFFNTIHPSQPFGLALGNDRIGDITRRPLRERSTPLSLPNIPKSACNLRGGPLISRHPRPLLAVSPYRRPTTTVSLLSSAAHFSGTSGTSSISRRNVASRLRSRAASRPRLPSRCAFMQIVKTTRVACMRTARRNGSSSAIVIS